MRLLQTLLLPKLRRVQVVLISELVNRRDLRSSQFRRIVFAVKQLNDFPILILCLPLY